MPDFNPDREGHVKHKWLVQKANTFGPLNAPVMTSKGPLKTSKKGRFFVTDPTLAAEIRAQYPADYAVTRVRTPAPADRGHNYFFGQMPELPWKKEQPEDQERQEERKEDQDV